MRFLISFMTMIIILTACASLPENVIQNTASSRDFKKIEEIDLLLLEYQFKNEAFYLSEAEEQIQRMLDDATLNKEYKASLYGLLGEIENLKGNKTEVKSNLEQLRLLSAREENAYILSSFLKENNEDQIKELETGLATASTTGKIKLHLARLYFTQGEYEKSTAFYDDAFSLLSPKYTEYYEEERNIAYQFIYNPPKSIKTGDLLTKNKLSLSDIIMLTFLQTNFLDNISVNKTSPTEKLFKELSQAGYFHNRTLDLSIICKRKDAAYFLLKIIAYLENDSKILTKYSEDYVRNNKPSPVPDVIPSEYYFNAVLILVEREIMEIPDGINFYPENTLSGVEFNEILNRIKNKYF